MNPADPAPTPSPDDLTALGELFAEHEPRLRAMLQRRIDPVLAARLEPGDILGEAFLVARRKWAGFREQGKMSAYAWLYRIALDCLIDAWRRETAGCRDVRVEMPWPEQSSVQMGLSLVCSDTGPSTAAVRREMQERMRQLLDLLGPRDREILWMRHGDGLSFPEAAAILGIEEGTANVRYVRALRRLRDLWHTLEGEVGRA